MIVYARPVVIDLERGSQAHAIDGAMSRASFPLAALCETAPPGGYWAELSATCELGRPMCVICMGRLVTRLGSMDAAIRHREQGDSAEQRLRVINSSRRVELEQFQFEEDIEALLETPDAAQLDGDGLTTLLERRIELLLAALKQIESGAAEPIAQARRALLVDQALAGRSVPVQ